MQAILSVVAPVFLIIGLGWLSARRGLVDKAGFAGLNRSAFTFCAPALLFLGGTSGQAGGGRTALAFFLGAALLYAGLLVLARRRLPLGEAGALALDATYGNAVMMGIPLILAAFGEQALGLLLAVIALHSMLMLGAATIVAEIGLHARAPWQRVLRATVLGVVRNPVVMAVVAALAWRLLGLPPLTGLLRRTLEMLGAATPPAALFCLGGSLLGFDARGAWRTTLLIAGLKLLALPALVWAIARLLGLSPLETAVAVVAAALPTGANAFMLAQRYRLDEARSGATVLVSTAASVVTLSLLIAWLR
ncbi:AEC family transporter [Paracraurococcus lichenis]|uniref:AEC family transporter n=1 Tax=Paracraurococcus lichenis TaxID=3064888 RepID=A0ABT9DXS7_9PROT|nr:AEC family transporter [Paracraurococcus sp. LOR1-02]MDO9708704.1 AEC family transporter [Paracraurococcus sp. LOR1-02]